MMTNAPWPVNNTSLWTRQTFPFSSRPRRSERHLNRSRVDDQGKEIGLKERCRYVDEFEENDAWKTNNSELDADLESGYDKSF